MFLNGTADLLRAITDAASDIEVAVDYADKIAATEPTGDTNYPASITTATTTTLLAGHATALRKVKNLTLHNNHATVSCLIRIDRTNGTDVSEVCHATLLATETLAYTEGRGWYHLNGNGAEYSDVPVNEPEYLSISGAIAETMPREICTETNTVAPTASGTLFLQAIKLRRGQIVTNISFFSATTASGTPTNGFFALYDSARNLLAQTANFTTEAWAATTIKTKALTAAYTVSTTGLYYVGIMITATTIPTLKGNTARTGGQLASTAPIIAGASTTGLTTSLPNPAAAITANGLVTVWAAIT